MVSSLGSKIKLQKYFQIYAAKAFCANKSFTIKVKLHNLTARLRSYLNALHGTES